MVIGDNGKIYVWWGAAATPVKKRKKAGAFWRWIPDGKNRRYFARGLRNAVGLRWFNGHYSQPTWELIILVIIDLRTRCTRIKDGAWLAYCFHMVRGSTPTKV